MTISLFHLNVWAVFISGIAAFLLGGVWYTALFGQRRIALCGYTEEQLADMQKRRPPPVFFSLMILCYLVVAIVMDLVAAVAGVDSASGGMMLGLLIWIGPAAAIGMTVHLASDKPWGVYLIDTGFQLIFLVMMGAIIGSWT